MNQQPYQIPPCSWSPQLNPAWIRFWRGMRKRRGYREHALRGIEVRNADVVRQVLAEPGGTLVAPNHPSHADPFALLEAADQLGTPMHFMTAWQVFAGTHLLGRKVLQQHGCFSINREGHDIGAVRQAVRVLEKAESPLVIFPEGEVYHLNDRVTPFRKGAVQTAIWAARRSGEPVSIIPCGIKFQFTSDPTMELEAQMGRLELAVNCPATNGQPLVERIIKFGEFMMSAKEFEVLGYRRFGTLGARAAQLIESILAPLEERYGLASEPIVPDRVKFLRRRVIWHLETPDFVNAPAVAIDELQTDLKRLFLVTQLYSYRVSYLAGDPPVERLAETLEKYTEDVLGLRRAIPPAERRGIISFAEPLVISPQTHTNATVVELTEQLRQRVQSVVDEISETSLSRPQTWRIKAGDYAGAQASAA